MENTQPLPNQQSTETSTQPQVKQNNSRLFVVIVISVLLTAVITGSAVYFWQRTANEQVVNSLEQELDSLKEQISIVKKVETVTQPISPPATSPTPTTDPARNWKIYANNNYHYQLLYPPMWVLIENKDYITLYDEEGKQNPSEINARMAIYPENPSLYNGVGIHEPVGTRREIGDKIFEEKIADLLLDGRSAAKYRIDVLPGSQTDAFPGILVKVEINSVALYIRLYAPNETILKNSVGVFDKILSTFKFTG